MKTLFFFICFLLVFNTFGQWSRLYPLEASYVEVNFYNDTLGFLLSTSDLFKTTTGGEFWTVVDIPEAEPNMNDVLMINENVIWCSSDDNVYSWDGGALLRSDDGGINWEVKIQHDKYGFKEIFFVDEFHGWVTTDFDVIYRTTDGGDTWIISEEFPMSYIRGIFFLDKNTGWICGDDFYSIIYKTTDGGITWVNQLQLDRNIIGLWDIEFVNDQKGFAVGYNRILMTTDNGGEVWEYLASETFEGVLVGIPPEYAVRDIEFIDENRGWICGGPC